MENKSSRPLIVTLLAVGVLMFAGYQLSRVLLISLNLPLLRQLGLPAYLPPLLILAALGQMLGGLVVAIGFWQGQSRVSKYAHWLIVWAIFAYWFNRLVLAENTLANHNWGLILGLQISFWFVYFKTPTLPETQTHFGANHDR